MTLRYPATTASLLLAAHVFAAPPRVVEELSGKVIAVTDGNTIKVLINKTMVTLRHDRRWSPGSRDRG